MAGKIRQEGLTAKQQLVYDLLVLGRSNKEIAQHVGNSVRTVEVHRANIYRKAGVRNVVELVRKMLGGHHG